MQELKQETPKGKNKKSKVVPKHAAVKQKKRSAAKSEKQAEAAVKEKVKVNKADKNELVEKKERNYTWLKVLLGIVIALVVVFAIVTIYANLTNSIFPNTFIADKSVSGMSTVQLSDYITSTYSADKLADDTLTVVCRDKTEEVEAEDLKIEFDNATYVEKVKASGREGHPLLRGVNFISRLFTPVEVNPVITYDEEALNEAFNSATAEYEKEPIGYTYDVKPGNLIIHNCVDGIKADRSKAKNDFESQVARLDFKTINLEPVPVEPAPLNVDEFYGEITGSAKEAYYERIDGKVSIVPSKAQCELEIDAVKDAIKQLESTGNTDITVPAKTTEPEKTTEVLTERLYKDELGKYSTNYGGSSGSRATNVRLAVERVNGTELMPGEVFSYDKKILPRTPENGYMPAGVFIGNQSAVGWGGGICQPSSTLYAAALYANMEILERYNHSLPVSYLPYGMDATIAEGVLDFKFRNNTEYPIKIVSSADGGVCTFKIMGYDEKNTTVEIAPNYGGGNGVVRVVKVDGKEVEREVMGVREYKEPKEDEKKDNKTEKSDKSEKSETTSSSDSSN